MNQKYNKEQYDKMIMLYQSGSKVSEICKAIPCEMKAIYRAIKRTGNTLRPPIAKQHDLIIVAEYQSGRNCSDIADYLKISVSSVINSLKRQNISLRSMSETKRKYTSDSKFFEKIDTAAKAYLLGLWCADGNNDENNGQITLALIDKVLVETAKILLSSQNPIYERQPKKTTQSKVFTITIRDRILSTDLARVGCIQRKTMVLQFPSAEIVPPHLVRDYVRGYFDGDGCIHRRKNSNNYVVHIVGTKDFITDLQTVLPLHSHTDKLFRCFLISPAISPR